MKKCYVYLNAIIYRKGYRAKIRDQRISDIIIAFPDSECFGGYYDKSSINNNGLIVGHITNLDTRKLPDPQYPVTISIFDLASKSNTPILKTSTYTWQQGARTHWIDENDIIFNNFKNGRYIAQVFSLNENKIIHEYVFPVQDSFKNEYFLSINYSRIMALRPDYGYRNLPALSATELDRLDNDGIWKVDFADGHNQLILTLADIVKCQPKDTFNGCYHKANHIMISPDGEKFIFIHRWYKGKRRFDRLMLYDFASLKVLSDDQMVSHMCWIDNNTVFGYLKHNGQNGFYFINVNSGEFKECATINKIGSGDGHPTVYKNWIAFDTYPDKSRMQTLYLYNILTNDLITLLELYHSPSRFGECRCDLHPRFSKDGKHIAFDSVYNGVRELCLIDVSKITH